MAVVAKDTNASLDTSTGMFAPQVTGNVFAGSNLGAAVPCYIDTTTGLVLPCDGTAADLKAVIAGWTPKAYLTGEAVTLLGIGARFRYANGTMTPGAKLYLSTTPGALQTTASTGDAVGAAQAIDASDIRVTRNI